MNLFYLFPKWNNLSALKMSETSTPWLMAQKGNALSFSLRNQTYSPYLENFIKLAMKKKLREPLPLNSYHNLTLELPCSSQSLTWMEFLNRQLEATNLILTHCPEVFDKMSMGTPTICSEVTKHLQGKLSR